MNFRSNKTAPQPSGQKLEGTLPSATKVKLEPAMFSLIRNVKEKKIGKSTSMKISD